MYNSKKYQKIFYNGPKVKRQPLYTILGGVLTDRDFVLYGYDRGYYTLRFDRDKKLEKIFNSVNHKFQKSNAHREFIEWFFDIDITKDIYFDCNHKFDVIQYPSDKNGYHVQRVKNCMELMKGCIL